MSKLLATATALFTAVSISQVAQSATPSKIELQGYVVSFDDKNIRLESGTNVFEVPRAKYAYSIKAGEKISIPMESSEVDALKKSPVKPEKK